MSKYRKIKMREDFTKADEINERVHTARQRDFKEMERISKMRPAPRNLVEKAIDPTIE